jgi:hypothetical protein
MHILVSDVARSGLGSKQPFSTGAILRAPKANLVKYCREEFAAMALNRGFADRPPYTTALYLALEFSQIRLGF